LLKRLRDKIRDQRWPAYIETPLVGLVYLIAIGLGAALLGVCCVVVLVLSPMAWAWLHAA